MVMEADYLALQQEKQQATDAANQLPGPVKWGRVTSPANLANKVKDLQKKLDMEITAKSERSRFGNLHRSEDRMQAM
jgi:hypothetical protein